MSRLLSRDEFREGVFVRDKHFCVVCKAYHKVDTPAVDTHHIIERKLWPDEGYYLENGASLCEFHHRLAETGHISPQLLRMILNVKTIIPEGLNTQNDYDKWGRVLSKWQRDGVSVHMKYPSTSYLSFSPGGTGDKDREIADIKDFLNVSLVFTTKMDGSNVKINNKFVAARNGLVATHKSFDLLKSMHPVMKDLIPEDEEVFGEWLYAKHSIHYKDGLKLNSYLQVFAVFNKNSNLWSGWGEVERIAKSLNFPTPPRLVSEEIFTNSHKLEAHIKKLGDSVIAQGHEGIVVRSAYPIHFGHFNRFIAKYVRKDHVQTDEHWSNQVITKNEVLK